MIFERELVRYGFSDLCIYTAADITDAMIEDGFKISDSFFGTDYSIRNSPIKDVIKSHGKFCFIVYNKAEKKVIGYSYYIPIKISVFKEFKEKEEMLLSLKDEYCADFSEPKINLFCAGEAFVTGYDLDKIHRALEDIFQWKVLSLAKKGTKIATVSIEAVCKYDEEYLVKLLGLNRSVKKHNSTFYCDQYLPEKVFSRSIYVKDLIEYYK